AALADLCFKGVEVAGLGVASVEVGPLLVPGPVGGSAPDFGEDAAERPDLKVGLRRGVGCLVGRAARGGPRVRGVGGDGQAQAVAVLAADEVGDGAGGGVGGGGVGVGGGEIG